MLISPKTNFLFKGILLLVLVISVGCQKVSLLEGLSQRDANEVIVLLNRNHIPVKQIHVEKQQATTIKLEIEKDDEMAARQLLIAAGLPRVKSMGLSEICKDTGLIPTPKMEKCREMLGLKGEIINSLQSIPGVITADVVINLPEKDDFPDPNQPQPRPSASVVVQMDTQNLASTSLDESKIQQFVANAVTGMDIRDVAVIIGRTSVGVVTQNADGTTLTASPETVSATDVAAQNPVTPDNEEEVSDMVSIGGIEMTQASAQKFKMVLAGALVLFMTLSVALIVFLLKSVRSRKVNVKGGLVPQGAVLPEKVDMDALIQETGGASKSSKK